MKRFIVLSFLVLLGGLFVSTQTTGAQVPPSDCPRFDYKCQENQRTNCDAWDYQCKDDTNGCPTWDSSCKQSTPFNRTSGRTSVQYTEKVSCTLVLKQAIGGISGYCKESPGANLNHCIVDEVELLDPYSVTFLCADGRPDLMATSSRNEVRLNNLGPPVSFGAPYWIICDEGMRAMATNKRCYDSEFSKRDDWDTLCEVDKRLDKVYDYPETYQWYVCP